MSLNIKPNSKYFFTWCCFRIQIARGINIFINKVCQNHEESFQEAINLEPKNILLIAQVDVLVSIPSIFGEALMKRKVTLKESKS